MQQLQDIQEEMEPQNSTQETTYSPNEEVNECTHTHNVYTHLECQTTVKTHCRNAQIMFVSCKHSVDSEGVTIELANVGRVMHYVSLVLKAYMWCFHSSLFIWWLLSFRTQVRVAR